MTLEASDGMPLPYLAERFDVTAHAGRGGTAVVFRAFDRLLRRDVAVKVLESDDADSAYVRREVEILSHLSHPGIVAYLDDGKTHDGRPFVVTEWLEGETLQARLNRGPLTLRESVQVVLGVASALAHAHARGIVHRDVKPSNVFLLHGDPRVPKLLDFGIARPQHATFFTVGTGLVGTPGYLAPEQARGEEVDARADVFSLGTVLFECVTGQPLFGRGSTVVVLSRLLLDEIPTIRALCPDVSPALDALAAAMLARDPSGRPRDARALLRPLGELGVLPDARAVPASPSSSIYFEREQRLYCVLVAGKSEEKRPSTPVSHLTRRGDAHEQPSPLESATVLATVRAPTQGTHEGRASGSTRPSSAAPSVLASLVESHGFRAILAARGPLLAVRPVLGVASEHARAAAHCAVALREAAPDLPIAIALGHASLDGPEEAGEVLQRALLLLRSAMRGGESHVFLDDATAGLLEGRFDLSRAGDASARGDDTATQIWELGAEAAHDRRAVTTFAGRERELRRIREAFAQAVEESVPRVLLVTADAGAGKSRLLAEGAKAVRIDATLEASSAAGVGLPARVLSVTGDIAERGVPYALARRLLDSGDDGNTTRWASLLNEVAGATEGSPARSLAPKSDEAYTPDLMAHADDVRRAFAAVIAALARERPLLLVMDDLHWGDAASVRLIDDALRAARGGALLVLAGARPDVREFFPDLWAYHARDDLRLGPLPRAVAARLVADIASADLSAASIERIVDLGSGNPFVLEELARVRHDDAPGAPEASIVAMVGARLSALDDDARRLLRAASVIGDRFWIGAVSVLVGQTRDELEAPLARLEAAGIVQRSKESLVKGELELRFQHSLVREAAERMLSAENATAVHAAAALWLETHLASDALRIARHWESAHDLARASTAFLRAAQEALAAGDLDGSMRAVDRGLAGAPSRAEAGALHLVAAEGHFWRGEHALTRDRATAAMESLPAGTADYWRAARSMALALGKVAEVSALRALGKALLIAPVAEKIPKNADPRATLPPHAGEAAAVRLVALARAGSELFVHGALSDALALVAAVEPHIDAFVDTPKVQAELIDAVSVRCLSTGDIGGYLKGKERVVDACVRGELERDEALQRVRLGYACMCVGDFPRAKSELLRALAKARARTLAQVETLALHNLGLTLALLGDTKAGAEAERAALDAALLQGDVRIEHAARVYLARIHSMSGNPGAAEDVLGPLFRATVSPSLLSEALAELARAQLLRGLEGEAFETATRSIALMDPGTSVDEGELVVRAVYLEVLVATGRIDEARIAAAAAVGRVREQAARIEPATLAQTFVREQPDVRRILELAARVGGADPAKSSFDAT